MATTIRFPKEVKAKLEELGRSWGESNIEEYMGPPSDAGFDSQDEFSDFWLEGSGSDELDSLLKTAGLDPNDRDTWDAAVEIASDAGWTVLPSEWSEIASEKRREVYRNLGEIDDRIDALARALASSAFKDKEARRKLAFDRGMFERRFLAPTTSLSEKSGYDKVIALVKALGRKLPEDAEIGVDDDAYSYAILGEVRKRAMGRLHGLIVRSDAFPQMLVESGLTQAELARATDTHPTTVYRWHSGDLEVPQYALAVLKLYRRVAGYADPETLHKIRMETWIETGYGRLGR